MRIHPRFTASLLTLCLLPSASTLAENGAPPPDEKPILLSPVEISEKTTRRKVYDAKVESLWDAKQKKRTISYLEVLNSAYDTSRFDLVKCLLEKKTYRETVARKHPFYCNYAAATIEVEIKWTLPSGTRRGGLKSGEGSTKQGVGFDYKNKLITLWHDAPFPFLLHASGAALSGFPSKKTSEEIQKLVAKNENGQFSDHVQFELKLQDMNRYYATFTGTPIMKPLDAVHALAMFGHVPNKNLVASILKRHGVVASEAQLAAALKADKVKRDGKTTTFELAYRLVDGVSAFGIMDDGPNVVNGEPTARLGDPEDLARFQVEDGLNQKNRAEYATMLEQIIIQAPGHI